MSAALVIVYACLAAVEVAVVVAWVVATRRHRWPVRPTRGDVVIGGVTSFLDTLGIGNYAQITALFKLRRHPPDEQAKNVSDSGTENPRPWFGHGRHRAHVQPEWGFLI